MITELQAIRRQGSSLEKRTKNSLKNIFSCVTSKFEEMTSLRKNSEENSFSNLFEELNNYSFDPQITNN